MDKPSLQKYIFERLLVAPFVKELNATDCKVCIITAAGTIYGNVPELPKNGADFNPDTHFIPSLIHTFCKMYKQEFQENDNSDCDEGYLTLEDVTMVSETSKRSFKHLVIFRSQIIAITLVPMSEI